MTQTVYTHLSAKLTEQSNHKQQMSHSSSENKTKNETSHFVQCWHGSGMLSNTTISPNIHPSGRLGGWATPRSAEEMLDGQRQRVHIPAQARTADNSLLQKRLEEDLC